MKAKPLFIAYSFIAVALISFLLISCQQKKTVQSKTVLDSIQLVTDYKDTAAVHELYNFIGTPAWQKLIDHIVKINAGISEGESNALKGDRANLTYNPSGPGAGTTVKFADTKIFSKELMAYFDRANLGYLAGIRLYPAFIKASDTVASIICVSEKDATRGTGYREVNYFLLRKPQYDFGSDLANTPNYLIPDTAKKYIDDYFNYVYYRGGKQNPEVNASRSRYYPYLQFMQMMEDNAIFPDSDPLTPVYYTLENGYLNYSWANQFKTTYPNNTKGSTAAQLVGHTFIFTLYNGAVPEVNPHLPGSDYNYTSLQMEIGKPCPPYCSALYTSQ
jgi:hypothetical protein